MAKTGHPNFQLFFTSSWRGKPHVWSWASSHSGSSFTTRADVLSFLNSVQDITAAFIAPSSTTFCSGWKYFTGQGGGAIFYAEYANAAASTADGFTNTSYGSAYVAGTGGIYSGLETCVVLEAPVGLSKTNKPVTLKKFVHAVPGGTAADQPPLATAAQTYAAQLGNGGLFGSRVLISGSGKQGAWVANEYFGNHQMTRRKKKKASGGLSFSDLLTLAKDGVTIGVSDA